jgi:uncharacterized protein (TIGR00297 family)
MRRPWTLVTAGIAASTPSCFAFINPSISPVTNIVTHHIPNERIAVARVTSLHASPLISAIPTIPPTDIIRTCLGVTLAHRISKSGLKKGSLSKSGALSAFIVASLSLATSWRNGITLLSFYLTSSKLTRVGVKIKGKLEEGVTEGGERGASQVFACSLIGVICACIRRIGVGKDSPLLLSPSNASSLALLGDQLTLAYVAFFACCAGDTWASELGILSRSLPRLIVKPWKRVPPGTNGGVSGVGLLVSAIGGLVMGLIHGLFVPGGIASLIPSTTASATTLTQFAREVQVLAFVGFVGGLGGSLLDSLLGATIQATWYDEEAKKIAKRPGPTTRKVGGFGFLSNEMVNVVSTAVSALVVAMLAGPLLQIM